MSEPTPQRQETGGEDAPTTLTKLRREAAALFARRGYGGTSISEIASRVGIRKASLYNYFSSKEELLLDLVDECLAAWKATSRGPLDGDGPLEGRLREHLLAAVDFTRREPEKVAILRVACTQIGGDLGRRVESLLADRRQEYFEVLAGLFSRGVESGELEPGSATPEQLGLTWLAFLDGLLSNLVFHPGTSDPFQDHIEAVWALTWRGLSGGWPEGGGE